MLCPLPCSAAQGLLRVTGTTWEGIGSLWGLGLQEVLAGCRGGTGRGLTAHSHGSSPGQRCAGACPRGS